MYFQVTAKSTPTQVAWWFTMRNHRPRLLWLGTISFQLLKFKGIIMWSSHIVMKHDSDSAIPFRSPDVWCSCQGQDINCNGSNGSRRRIARWSTSYQPVHIPIDRHPPTVHLTLLERNGHPVIQKHNGYVEPPKQSILELATLTDAPHRLLVTDIFIMGSQHDFFGAFPKLHDKTKNIKLNKNQLSKTLKSRPSGGQPAARAHTVPTKERSEAIHTKAFIPRREWCDCSTKTAGAKNHV